MHREAAQGRGRSVDAVTPHAFITKWRASALKERSASQEHFIDLCHLLDEPTPAEADPSGETYCFERGARKDTGGDGWADVWKRHHFAWEYKGQRADLDAAFDHPAGPVTPSTPAHTLEGAADARQAAARGRAAGPYPGAGRRPPGPSHRAECPRPGRRSGSGSGSTLTAVDTVGRRRQPEVLAVFFALRLATPDVSRRSLSTTSLMGSRTRTRSEPGLGGDDDIGDVAVADGVRFDPSRRGPDGMGRYQTRATSVHRAEAPRNRSTKSGHRLRFRIRQPARLLHVRRRCRPARRAVW